MVVAVVDAVVAGGDGVGVAAAIVVIVVTGHCFGVGDSKNSNT